MLMALGAGELEGKKVNELVSTTKKNNDRRIAVSMMQVTWIRHALRMGQPSISHCEKRRANVV